MKQIIQDLKSGATVLEEVPAPLVRNGYVLIRTTRTLVSLGTERMLVEFGKANLIDKEKAREEEVNLNFAQQVAFRSEDLTDEERDHVLKYLEFIKTQKKV